MSNEGRRESKHVAICIEYTCSLSAKNTSIACIVRGRMLGDFVARNDIVWAKRLERSIIRNESLMNLRFSGDYHLK